MADQDKSAEDDVAELRYLQNLYMQEYNAILTTMATYSNAQEALERSMETLDRFESIKDKTMLMDLEGGAYIRVKSENDRKVMTYVGAGYLVEKTFGDAKAFLSKSAERNAETMAKLDGQKRLIEESLTGIDLRLGTMSRE
jgi:prefoldin alpha subunit